MRKRNEWKLLGQENHYLLPEYSELTNLLISQIGINSEEDARSFIEKDIESLETPYNFFEIEKTAEEILKLIDEKRKIFIHGDYDADGIVATSILWDFLYRELGADVLPIVPNRFEDGYGLSENTIQKVVERDGDVIITVDCGIKDIEKIKKYSKIKFIITDHHTIPSSIDGSILIPSGENLLGIVHPQDPRGKVKFQGICGAFVAWKLIQVLTDKLKLQFDPRDYLDLVALAINTDIMPLIGDNRTVVEFGLKRIRTTDNPSIKALIEVANIEQVNLDTHHFGFALGPRINAAGRIDDAMQAVRLLATNDINRARQIAKFLDDLNIERQKMTTDLLDRAIDQIKNEKGNILIACGTDWPEGVIGLIAGKLQEKYSKPTVVCSINSKTNEVVGSARSPEKFNITKALEANSQYLIRFGGHVQAAGFQLLEKDFESFREKMKEYALKNISADELIPTIKINSELRIGDINRGMIEEIETLAPFGFGNPKPKFLFKNLLVREIVPIGKERKHIRLFVTDRDNSITCIGFNMFELFSSIEVNDKIDLVGTIHENEWNGRTTLQIEIKDIITTNE
jgi:single-stranded-DNA-specific exonuclease